MAYKNIIPVILCGGGGSRLWPLSNNLLPKPFLKMDDGNSLFMKTYMRACMITNCNTVLCISSSDFDFLCKSEIKKAQNDEIKNVLIFEPIKKNTSAALCLAINYIESIYGQDVLVVTLPADHIIGDHSKFEQIISSGYSKAKDCNFIIYGIEPTHVSTSFGYIKHTDNKFEGFVEKPNIDEARKYFNSDNYFWNSGMISAEVQTFKNGLSKHIPDIYSKTNKAISNCVKIMDENTKSLYVDEQDYKDIQEISIDHSLLEKIDNIEVIKFDTSWLDVGTWDQYATMFECDKNQNYINGETMMIDTNSCIISSDDKIIATLGIDNLIISDTKDALLVASKDRAQEVKDLYSKLKQIKHNSIESPSEVIRPWGKYEILKKGNNFKIKLITLNEKSSISLQHHNHRQEHWTVLSGKAEVIKNNEVSELKPSESITIPKGIKHRLINKQDFPLRICEIQQGDYLEEDDIIRHDDVYNRT